MSEETLPNYQQLINIHKIKAHQYKFQKYMQKGQEQENKEGDLKEIAMPGEEDNLNNITIGRTEVFQDLKKDCSFYKKIISPE